MAMAKSNRHRRTVRFALVGALAVACLALTACGGSGASSNSASSSASKSASSSAALASASSASSSSASPSAAGAVLVDLTKALDGVKADANNELWSEKAAVPNSSATASVCGKQRTGGFGYSVTLYFGSNSTNTVEAIGSNLYACYVIDAGLGSGYTTVVYSAGDSEASAQTFIASVNPDKELYFKYWSTQGGVYMSSAKPLVGVASSVTANSITVGSTTYGLAPDTMTLTAK